MSDHISEDTVVEILKCLPVKSLLRVRCVCKGWKQLIDSPTFLQYHLAHQRPCFLVRCEEVETDRNLYVVDSRTLYAVDPRTPSIDTVTYPVEFGAVSESTDIMRTRGFMIIGTHHGVVCLYDWKCRRELLIWNPTIRKSFTVTLRDCTYLIDPALSAFGFWIDPSTKEFKIIKLLCKPIIDNKGVFDVNLYSSTRHGWSVIPAGELWRWTTSVLCPTNAAVMIGDVGHWLGEYVNDYEHKLVILSFDFKQQSFAFIKMTAMDHFIQGVLCRWQGKLALLCWDYKDFEPLQRCDLYSRQQGNSWAHIFGFNYAPLAIDRVFWALEDVEESRDIVEQVQENGKVVATIDVDAMSRNLVLYDTKSGCIPLKSGISEMYEFDMVYDFVESLLFP